MVPLLTPLGSCDTSAVTSHVAPHFNSLDHRNVMVSLIMLGHHVMLVPEPLHNHKIHAPSHFNCPKLWKVMMLLMTPLASYDASAVTSGFT